MADTGGDELFGDDSSQSSDSSNGDTKKSKDKIETAAETTGEKENDEEDSDAEFDDNDGIEGSNAKNENNEGDSRSRRKQKDSKRIQVLRIPRIVSNNKTVSMHMTKLPNIVNINTEAFDRSTYNSKEEEKEYNGNVHNMIRWRYKKGKEPGELLRTDNGKLLRESNARVCKWSDGSLTLHVGEEVFDFDEINANSKKTNGFGGYNGYLFISQKATNLKSGTDAPSGTVLECMGPISSKVTTIPFSLNSTAHKNLTLVVRQRNTK